LFYSFVIDTKHLVIVSNDEFELKEEILSFFGDVDVLIIVGSKK
jgi:molybdopterin biosynthesis enzyme